MTIIRSVGGTCDGDGLWCSPVGSREGERGWADGGLGGIAARDSHCYITSWLAAEAHRECRLAVCLTSQLGGMAADLRDNQASGIIVAVGDADISGVQIIVTRIGANGWSCDDRIGDGVVVEIIVNTRDSNDLGHAPVGGREGERGRADGALGGVAAAQPDRHVGGRALVEHHREVGDPTRFARLQAARWCNGDAGSGMGGWHDL